MVLLTQHNNLDIQSFHLNNVRNTKFWFQNYIFWSFVLAKKNATPWNYVRILTFKVSKWLYPSSWYDRNIGKWRQCLLSIQNETKKIILILSCHRYKVQGSNQEPKTYFWNPSRFGLVGVPLVAIVDHFDTKQSMSCFEPTPTEEGPKGPPALRRS